MSDDTTVVVKFADLTSTHWSLDMDINKIFIQCTLMNARDRLRIRGHLFLNEIFDDLGLSRTSQGQITGWLYSEWDGIDPWTRLYEKDHIVITFETQGVIYDKIQE